MDSLVHSLSGDLLLNKNGLSRFFDILSENEKKRNIFTLSSPLSSFSLLSLSFINKNELDKKIKKMRGDYLKLFSSLLETESYVNELNSQFDSIKTVLSSIYVLREYNKDSFAYFLDEEGARLVSLLIKYACIERGINKVSIMDEKEILNLNSESALMPVVLVPSYSKDINSKSGRSEESACEIASKFNFQLVLWNSSSVLYSAPPSVVPNSHVIKHLTYEEATELSFFGAPILHPKKWIKAEEKNLQIKIRCFKNKSNECNIIDNSITKDDKDVKALSVLKNVALINTEGSGLSGVPGISSRIFTTLKNENISVIFISQASSEYSVCFAVKEEEESRALTSLREEFKKEIEEHLVSSIKGEKGLSIIAIVGDGMNGKVGIAGSFFSSLSRSGINVRAIAQGSSERNISAVISSRDIEKAEKVLHTALFLSRETLSVGLYGPGNIGGTLLDQIGKERDRLQNEFDLNILVRGIANSKKMLLSEKGVDLKKWREEFNKNSEDYNKERFLSHVGAEYYPHSVIVDCTSSEKISSEYEDLLEKGFHVITPNKKAPSGDYEKYKNIFNSSKKSGKKFYYETTVGAGLPIITTLKDLKETGDKIINIEGLLSGTLSWLFTSYDGTLPFSSLIRKAKELGYTEPDPRDDLSGMDVARKTIILSRSMGFSPSLEDMAIENLVPENLRSLSIDEFLSRCDEMDEKMSLLFKEAKEKNCTLRYFGKVENDKCSVGLGFFPLSHPFSSATGTDNVIQFRTERYNIQPLVVRGPGAGPEVTAAGVFGDILRLSAYLGSRV